ncbi:transport-associated protein [Desulfobulbus propionicus DSM 2032]|jgi:hyperosmotically inducible protein|uniref:Transport-associated protein n=1 Tax=Desulfobulbus propionicus (strain ATCC 33891 / DSM 2032 / VKM B-1956 / 1pr3) TaxID=577650 RepID=A0A7U3YL93_DESPD|nr:BON domain-containing protein [Desulfobulbus propionicus]ADW17462.1 transport-associated protein [Desulfobulbus propionicus DSM 2032]
MARKTFGLFLSLLCAVLLSLTVSCTTPAGRTTGQVVDDAGITTQVKADLLADKEVSGLAVSVETFKGEVVLTGAVDTPAQRKKAEQIASKVHGVTRVKNLIKLK